MSIYLLGGKLDNGLEISLKSIGDRHPIEIAIATLSTDRTLLLLGVPGTAKSWVSELNFQVQAIRGFNLIATANDRYRGVNDLSSVVKRRFNTVVFSLPKTSDEEVEIVRCRVESLGRVLE